ncbi:MAG: hypothetical protein ACOC0R_04960 [Mariniphaga sp.]
MDQKNVVRNLLYAIGLLALSVVSCNKDEKYSCEHDGKIIAYDFRECMCCPGWYIKINDDTLKFSAVPGEDALWQEVNIEGFPVYVEITYQPVTGECADENWEATCLKIKD